MVPSRIRRQPPVLLGIDERLLEQALGLVPTPASDVQLGLEDRQPHQHALVPVVERPLTIDGEELARFPPDARAIQRSGAIARSALVARLVRRVAPVRSARRNRSSAPTPRENDSRSACVVSAVGGRPRCRRPRPSRPRAPLRATPPRHSEPGPALPGHRACYGSRGPDRPAAPRAASRRRPPTSLGMVNASVRPARSDVTAHGSPGSRRHLRRAGLVRRGTVPASSSRSPRGSASPEISPRPARLVHRRPGARVRSVHPHGQGAAA